MNFKNLKVSAGDVFKEKLEELSQVFEQAQKKANSPKVAVIKLHGAIMSGGKQGSLNIDKLAPTIAAAFNSKAQAVALDLNCPGGSPVQSDLIAEEIRHWADKTKTPVYAFAQDVAASGGYWLACSADEIYASPSSITGSIGVIRAGFGFDKLIDKLGVERRITTRRITTEGDNKSKLDPFMPENKDDLKFIQGIQKEIHTNFKSYVKERRKGKLNGTDKKLMNGDVWTATDAKNLGIIDGVGSMRSILRDKFGEDVKLQVFSPRPSFNLLGALSGATQNSSYESIGKGAVDELFSRVDETALWSQYGLKKPSL
jgi:signal peptide peptidase SppA